MPRTPPQSYADALFGELDRIESAYVDVLNASGIRYANPNRPSNWGQVIGAANWGWELSSVELEAARMSLLERLRRWRVRFLLLFPHPVPALSKRVNASMSLLERWLTRSKSDTTIPGTTEQAVAKIQAAVSVLREARNLLARDEFGVRVVVDTNALIDEPDLTVYKGLVGQRYLVHVLPVVLRELDDHKRGGRTPELREAAKRADRRLKGFRDNGDVTVRAKVGGDVWVVFEHVEPKSEGLPSWLDLDVPDDRFVASALLLQSQHPASTLTVATSDLNLQNKLAAVGLPYAEPPAS